MSDGVNNILLSMGFPGVVILGLVAALVYVFRRGEALEAKRDGQVDGMDAAALSIYQALRERWQGPAVAIVERGLCQGCRITLPMSVLQKARSGLGLVRCVNCERILLVN